MDTVRVTIALDRRLLDELDRRVQEGVFPGRSEAIALALREKLEQLAPGCEPAGQASRTHEVSAEEALRTETGDWQDIEG